MRKLKHGPGKWGMPGGSQDSKDADALAAAEREFRSEIGEPPQHDVRGASRCQTVCPLTLAGRCMQARLTVVEKMLVQRVSAQQMQLLCSTWLQGDCECTWRVR